MMLRKEERQNILSAAYFLLLALGIFPLAMPNSAFAEVYTDSSGDVHLLGDLKIASSLKLNASNVQNYVLISSDSNGTMTWVPQSSLTGAPDSGDGDWTVVSAQNKLYPSLSGNVGINVSGPSSKLDVVGNTQVSNGSLDVNGGSILVDYNSSGAVSTYTGANGSNNFLFDAGDNGRTSLNSSTSMKFNIDSNNSDTTGTREFYWYRAGMGFASTAWADDLMMRLTDYGYLSFSPDSINPPPKPTVPIEYECQGATVEMKVPDPNLNDGNFEGRQLGCMANNYGSAGSTVNWYTAVSGCAATGGRLPTAGELYIVANRYTLPTPITNEEWTGDAVSGGAATLARPSSSFVWRARGRTTLLRYRCFYPRF